MPVVVLDGMKVECIREFGRGHGSLKILLIGKNQNFGCSERLIFVQPKRWVDWLLGISFTQVSNMAEEGKAHRVAAFSPARLSQSSRSSVLYCPPPIQLPDLHAKEEEESEREGEADHGGNDNKKKIARKERLE